MRQNQQDTETMTIAEQKTDPAVAELRQALQSAGPAAAIEKLIAINMERNEARPLLDALLLKARFELGLPGSGAIDEQIDPDLKILPRPGPIFALLVKKIR